MSDSEFRGWFEKNRAEEIIKNHNFFSNMSNAFELSLLANNTANPPEKLPDEILSLLNNESSNNHQNDEVMKHINKAVDLYPGLDQEELKEKCQQAYAQWVAEVRRQQKFAAHR